MNIALEQADSALTVAQELIEAGQLAEALTHLETAIAGFEGAGESYGLIIALKVASETNRDLGHLETSLEQVKRAHGVLIYTKPDAEQVADFATEVGSIYAQMGQLVAARIWYVQGLYGYEGSGRTLDAAHNLTCIAGLDRAEGAEDKAQEMLAAAYDLYEAEQKADQMIQTRLSMAQGLAAQGNTETALLYLTQVHHSAEELGEQELLGAIHQQLALVQAQLGNTDQAGDHLVQAKKLFATVGLWEDASFADELLFSLQKGQKSGG